LEDGLSSQEVNDVDGEENSDDAFTMDENGKEAGHRGVYFIDDLTHIDVDNLDSGHLLKDAEVVCCNDGQRVAFFLVVGHLELILLHSYFLYSIPVLRNTRSSYFLLSHNRVLLEQIAVLLEFSDSFLNILRFQKFSQKLSRLLVATLEHQIFRSFIRIFVYDVVYIGTKDDYRHEEDDPPIC